MEAEATILQLNKIAVDHLKNHDIETAHQCLRKAEKMMYSRGNENYTKLMGITYNNLGCLYKRLRKPDTALRYFNKALEAEIESPSDLLNYAGTHLNICAIRSQVGEHEKALSHAMKALSILSLNIKEDQNLITSLIIGYHNAAVEYVHLSQTIEATKCYKKGYYLALDKLGPDHKITSSLRKGLEKNMKKIPNQRFKSYRHRAISETPKSKSKHSIEKRLNTTHNYDVLPTIQVNHNFKSPFNQISINQHNQPNRYITGDRLQPMHITQGRTTPNDKSCEKKKNKNHLDDKPDNVKTLLRELNGGYTTSNQTPIIRPLTSNKNLFTSLGTQVEFSFKPIISVHEYRANAAIIIQKYWRGFMIRKKYKLYLCREKVKRAENDAKKAIEELENLQKQKQKFLGMKITKSPVNLVQMKRFNRNLYDNLMINPIVESKNIKLEKVIKLQSHIRRWLVQRKYSRMRIAAIKMQSAARM